MIGVATCALDQERGTLALARILAGNGDLVLASTLRASEEAPLEDTQARVRARRRQLDRFEPRAARSIVSAGPEPWRGLRQSLAAARPDLLVADWQCAEASLSISPEALLADPPCDVALVRGHAAEARRILVPVRGGRYAELAVRLAVDVARANGGHVRLLHVVPEERPAERLDLYRLLGTTEVDEDVVGELVVRAGDAAQVVLAEAASCDAVFLGASGRPGSDPLGPVARALLASDAPLVIVRTRVPVASSVFAMPALPAEREERERALRGFVDRWFLENTFASTEFADVQRLVERKERLGLRVSVALPALNEEATIGKVIRAIRSRLVERERLVDELVLIDSRSSDRTREIAEAEGVPVFIHDEILPESGAYVGKGEAMWKSMHVTTGDIVVWVDTDVVNFHPKFVYGIVGPLLTRPEIGFVKAFYRRPLRLGETVDATGGGRVTELAARPILNLLYPELSGLVQPLSGEQGGRRSLLERLPFFTGYGVETGLLIDVLRRGGLGAIAQVDMRERTHKHRPLSDLSLTSFEILQVALKRLGEGVLTDANASMKMVTAAEDGTLHLAQRHIPAIERPPLVTIPAYRAAHPRPAAQAVKTG